jgi:hypothetical protein
MPAMNSAPTDVFVATAYITITIDGGIRMPSAPDVVITPAPKPRRETLLHHRRQDDRADGDDRSRASCRRPAANKAQAITPARTEAAGPVADHRRREGDHPARDAAVREEVAGEE